jgi:hypothetical protein
MSSILIGFVQTVMIEISMASSKNIELIYIMWLELAVEVPWLAPLVRLVLRFSQTKNLIFN